MASTNNATRQSSTAKTARGGPANGIWARFLNMAIGAWLIVSAFLWAHSPSSQTNTWICGLLVLGFAAWAMWANAARYLNTTLAVWLFFSTLSMAYLSSTAVWNNVICAIAVFVLSLVPTRTIATRRLATRRQAYP